MKDWLLDSTQVETGAPVETDAVVDRSDSQNGNLVLVVDDVPDMRTLLTSTLQKRGYQTVSAPNGQAALEVARAHQPDLIITDWMMPQMTGPDLILAIREDTSGISGTPVILLTAKSDEESKLMGKELGADAFLGKPFNQEELASVTRNLLALKANERAVRVLNKKLTEGVLKRFLPPQLVDDIVAGRSEIDAQPKSVRATILYTDLANSTLMTRELGAEKTAELMNEYLTEMAEVIYIHGGTIDKFTGDGIMVLFGAPQECAPAEQVSAAAACGKAMQERLAGLGTGWRKRGFEALVMRIGINYGTVVVGTIGSPQRSDYTAFGAAVNLAARIESICTVGEVFVSHAAGELLPPNSVEFAGEYELKGFGKVKLHRLL